jgi:hypothetical protein
MTFTVDTNLPWIDSQYYHNFGHNVTQQDTDYDPNSTFSKENFERYIKILVQLLALKYISHKQTILLSSPKYP